MKYKQVIPKQFRYTKDRQRLLLRAVLAEIESFDGSNWSDGDVEDHYGNYENFNIWKEAIYGILSAAPRLRHELYNPVRFRVVEEEDD